MPGSVDFMKYWLMFLNQVFKTRRTIFFSTNFISQFFPLMTVFFSLKRLFRTFWGFSLLRGYLDYFTEYMNPMFHLKHNKLLNKFWFKSVSYIVCTKYTSPHEGSARFLKISLFVFFTWRICKVLENQYISWFIQSAVYKDSELRETGLKVGLGGGLSFKFVRPKSKIHNVLYVKYIFYIRSK